VPAGEAECVCLPKPVLPVALSVYRSSGAWRLSFKTPPCSVIAEYFVRIDDEKERSAGYEEEIDLMTGRPRARDWVMVPDEELLPGEHTVTARMVHRDGRVDGPHKLRFSLAEELLADTKTRLEMLRSSFTEFAEHQKEHTFLMFTVLFNLPETTVREIPLLGRRLLLARAHPARRPAQWIRSEELDGPHCGPALPAPVHPFGLRSGGLPRRHALAGSRAPAQAARLTPTADLVSSQRRDGRAVSIGRRIVFCRKAR